MSVFLSPVGGAGAQFFDNSGNVLTGGKLYTYAAGTTTPQATYTNSAGSTFHANPIVLDAAGRVPSGGEIWLASGVSYKFVLKTSSDVTIATYDNIYSNGDPAFAEYTPSVDSLLAPGPLTVKSALDQITNEDDGSSVIGFLQSGSGAVPRTVEDKLQQTVSVLDFGANTVPGTTDMTAVIQAALDATPFEVIFPDAGPYKTTAPITIPIGKSVQLGNAVIEAHFNNGYIFQFERDPANRPSFYLEGKGGAIRGAGAFAYDATLNGVLIESSSFSRVGGFSISAVNRPIVIAPSGARDCINNQFYNIDTNTNLGLRIIAGLEGGVTYQDCTGAQFNDIFFTCNDPAANAVELVAKGPAGSIFGLNFNRCSLNPVDTGGGTYIYMRADPAAPATSIYNIYFNNCEGELRFTGVTPTLPAIYMERVFNSKIQFNGYWDEANGIQLVTCSGNIFENSRDGVIAYTTAKFIDIDASSFGNTFINVYPQLDLLSTDNGYTNAPLAADYFQRIVDDSDRNNFIGLLSSNVNRVFRTDYLNLLNSGGDPINPLFPTSYPSTTTWVNNGDGTFTATLTSNNGFEFSIPPEIPLGAKVVIRLKYRFVGVTTETNWRLASSVGGTLRAPTMRISEDWVDMMYMTEITSRDCRVYSPSANPTVTLDVEKLEVFLDAFPYPPNYRPTDVYDNQFAAHPYGTTANRPVSPPLMTNYFDTTLNKLITWNGTNWRDGAGAIV